MRYSPCQERIGSRKVSVVVPDEPAVPGRIVGQENGRDQSGCEEANSSSKGLPKGRPSATAVAIFSLRSGRRSSGGSRSSLILIFGPSDRYTFLALALFFAHLFVSHP